VVPNSPTRWDGDTGLPVRCNRRPNPSRLVYRHAVLPITAAVLQRSSSNRPARPRSQSAQLARLKPTQLAKIKTHPTGQDQNPPNWPRSKPTQLAEAAPPLGDPKATPPSTNWSIPYPRGQGLRPNPTRFNGPPIGPPDPAKAAPKAWAPLMGRCVFNKSRPRQDDAQQLVRTSLLDCVHNLLTHFGRLQRINPRPC
jgi:hypothetical protein